MRDVQCDLLRQSCGRDQQRPPAAPLDAGATGGGSAEPSSSTADGEKVQRWTEFHEAAARLPDDLRIVFDLLWYQELSQAEVAGLLGIAVPTVKLRWMKARLQVQQALGGSPFDGLDQPEEG
jgi:RNA polymerase sigma factor (sigma-70 family)